MQSTSRFDQSVALIISSSEYLTLTQWTNWKKHSMKLQKENHYEWQKENFKAYDFVRSVKKVFRINSQVDHAKWQKEKIRAFDFVRSAKKMFRINTEVDHAKWQKENIKAYAFARSAKKNFWK